MSPLLQGLRPYGPAGPTPGLCRRLVSAATRRDHGGIGFADSMPPTRLGARPFAARRGPLACLLLLAFASSCLAAADQGAGALAPLPRASPLAPGGETNPANDEDRLLHALDRGARERDERIQSILRTTPGVRPIATGELGPGLAQPLADRNQALADLRGALDEYLGKTHRSDPDALDAHGAVRQGQQAMALSAANEIAIVECIQALAGQERGEERRRRLDQGLKELAGLPAEMDDALRPRAAYLQVWFLSECARAEADPAARADHAARARNLAAGFAGSFPQSELAPAVAALVADLPAAGSAP